MQNRWIGAAALLVFGLAQATAASAQGGVEDPSKPAAEDSKTGVDVSRLAINLARIQRQLRQSTVRDESDGLRLRYTVEVFGQTPRIELFPNRDYSLTGPAPYGAPTHRELLLVITPQEYRAPAADFSGILRWLSGRSKDK